MSPSDFSDMLSNYVDGSLSESQRHDFESYLREHPSARQELAQAERLKKMLAEKKMIEPDIAFWTRLSLKIEDQKKEASNLLPFPRRYTPAILALSSCALILAGVFAVQQRMVIMDFLTKKTQSVQIAYKKNVSGLLPFFASIDKDQALQFSLFGTLPLDEKNETALRVDGNAQKGYRIEVRKTAAQKQGNITYRQFVDAVNPTAEQTRVLDSLLELAGKRIESSVLVGENNAFAVDPSLAKLNSIMVTSIAANLEPVQRVRMERLMASNEAPYAISGSRSGARIMPEHIFKHFADARAGRKFVVITSDTTLNSEIAVNMDSIEHILPRDMAALQALRNRMIKNFFTRNPHSQPGQSLAGDEADTGEDSRSIGVQVTGQTDQSGASETFPVYVTPRPHKASRQTNAKRLEIHTGNEGESK
jgi:hypothetical protein